MCGRIISSILFSIFLWDYRHAAIALCSGIEVEVEEGEKGKLLDSKRNDLYRMYLLTLWRRTERANNVHTDTYTHTFTYIYIYKQLYTHQYTFQKRISQTFEIVK